MCKSARLCYKKKRNMRGGRVMVGMKTANDHTFNAYHVPAAPSAAVSYPLTRP